MNESDRIGTVRIIAMRGLPRSGKSTVSKRISDRFGIPIVSRDAIRLALHGEAYIHEREEEVTVIHIQMVRALCYAGHESVILDGCHVDVNDATEKVSRIFRGTKLEHTLEFAVVDATTKECKERAIECGQPYLLPVIDRMAQAWTV